MPPSLERFAEQKLAELESRNQRRTLVDTDRAPASRAYREGRDVISFCDNDYLSLSQDARVKAAASEALARLGAGSGASRLITGNHSLFGELERRLAALKGTDDAVVFGSGYLANLGIIPTLVGPDDLILADELCHACLLAGTKLSGAAAHSFRHNDLGHLVALLDARREGHRRCLILTDGVFSMDGDLAPLVEMGEIAERYDAWLMSDDAHGIGVVGGGKGSAVATGERAKVPLQMGTLSKAVGAYGGYLCAAQPVIDLIKTRARTLVYSTGLPPSVVASAIAALDIIAGEPEFCATPVEKAARFCRALNLPAPESPIVPVIIGEEAETLAASGLLLEEGFLVTAIRPPTVPAGTSRLRFTFTATHDDADIDRLAALVRTRILKMPAA